MLCCLRYLAGGGFAGAGGRDRERVDGAYVTWCPTCSSHTCQERAEDVRSKSLILLQGYCLLHENMLPSVLFARDKWLKKVRDSDAF